MRSLRSRLGLLLLLSIKGTTIALQEPQSGSAKSTYSSKTIILNFDDLATQPATGIGPDGSFSYEGIHFQSITVINTTAAAHSRPPLIDIHDIFCATSWPIAIIGSRSPRNGAHVLPRLSLRDLYISQEPSAAEENVKFNVVALSMAPLGFVPGTRLGYNGAEVHVNFFRMPQTPSPHSTVESQTTFPGLVPGEPIHDRNLAFSELTGFYNEGWHPSLPVYLRDWFGPDFASGVDVIEIYGEVSKFDEAGEWSGVEDWPFCIDDIVLEVVQGKSPMKEQVECKEGA